MWAMWIHVSIGGGIRWPIYCIGVLYVILNSIINKLQNVRGKFALDGCYATRHDISKWAQQTKRTEFSFSSQCMMMMTNGEAIVKCYAMLVICERHSTQVLVMHHIYNLMSALTECIEIMSVLLLYVCAYLRAPTLSQKNYK